MRPLLPSADRAQQLGAPSVNLVPSGRVKVSEKVTLWPADADTGGSSILVADFGSLGAAAGGEPSPEGTESGRSAEMGNWRERRFVRLGLSEEDFF